MPKPRVVFVTNIPSHYQIDLFDAIAAADEVDLHVIYLRSTTGFRHWKRIPDRNHSHELLPVLFERSAFYLNPTLPAALARARADLFVVCQYAGLSYQALMALATLFRVPWAFWSERHGVQHFEVPSPLPAALRPLGRKVAFWPAARFARAIWGVGERARQQMAEISGRPCASLPYVFSTDRFARGAAPYAPEGRVRLLFAGSLSYRKGFDVFCDAAQRLAQRGLTDGWEVSVAGKGPMGHLTADVLAKLPVPVRDLGFLEADEVPDAMRAHDVFVVPSRYDGWGIVVHEAMAAGLSVIASDEMGSAVDLGSGHPFLKTPVAGDPDALADALAGFVQARDQLPELGRAAAAAAQAYDAREGARIVARLSRQALGIADAPAEGLKASA